MKRAAPFLAGLALVLLSASSAGAYTYEIEGETSIPEECVSTNSPLDPPASLDRTVTARVKVLAEGIVPRTVDVDFDVFLAILASSGGHGTADAYVLWSLTGPDGIAQQMLEKAVSASFDERNEIHGHFGVRAPLSLGVWYTLTANVSLSSETTIDEPGGPDWACGQTYLSAVGLPDLPSVRLEVPDPVASEDGPSTGCFKLVRTGGNPSTALDVKFVVRGTAVNGVDYESIPRRVTIPAGASSTTFTVTPIDDATPEGPETLTLILEAEPWYSIVRPRKATVTIVDNDEPAPVTLPAHHR